MGALDAAREAIARRVAGEITLSKHPGQTMKKWREIFNISQTALSKKLGVSPSVISDYERNRRKSPGINIVKRYVEALIAIDIERGGHTINSLSRLIGLPSDVILDLREFTSPITIREFTEAIDGEVLACQDMLERNIWGYTVIESVIAIQTMSGHDFLRLFGATTERALVFTNVSRGRSPMIAVKVYFFKPRLVAIHGPKKVDWLAIKLAEDERIPLILSKIPTVDELIACLRNLSQTTK